MSGRTRLLPAVVLLFTVILAHAREWRSADGQRTFSADFIAVRGEDVLVQTGAKTTVLPLASLAKEDQEFAKNAHLISEAAKKWGPQNFEISAVTDGGWLCRLALPATRGSPLSFGGELFFLVVADPLKGKQGERFDAQLLHGAGGRTFHPVKGEPTPIRAFALSAEQATRVWTETVVRSQGDPSKQSPPVLEPDIDQITMRGMGVVVARNGIVLADPALLEDTKTLVVHHKGDHYPVKVIMQDDTLGVAILQCDVPVEPARIGPKRPIALGQIVFAINVALSSTKKKLADNPSVTEGIISQHPDAKFGAFTYDATVPPETIGGFVLGDKGDVLGLFFNSLTTGRALSSKKSAAEPPPADALARAISTSSLPSLLDGVSGVAPLKPSSTGGDMGILSEQLMASTVLVISTREVKKPRVVVAPKTTQPPQPGGPATGWSLSKSGTRHNAKCRFFNATLPCSATDGKACKACGG